MNRRIFLLGALSAVTLGATASAAFAASYTEDVVAQLVGLGFGNITAETTLLGRVKIVARRSDGVREIVINPRTGEILRDVWTPVGQGGAARTVLHDIDDSDDNSGSGRDDGDNSGKGSGDDDGGDDDNSGSGSGDDRDDRNDDRNDDRDDDKGDDRDNKRDD